MKLTNKMTAAGAILAGGLMFAGSASAATVFTEDFESASQTGGGAAGAFGGGTGGSFGAYGTAQNFSGDLHTTSVTGGGSFYGHTIGVTNPAVSDVVVLAAGDTQYTFSAWLASYTGDGDYTTVSVEYFSDVGGTASLGSVTLADGSAEGTSTTPSGAWNAENWTNYTATGTVAAGSQSFKISYGGVGNDTYADNISYSVTAVPEPSSTTLLGLGALALILRRRK